MMVSSASRSAVTDTIAGKRVHRRVDAKSSALPAPTELPAPATPQVALPDEIAALRAVMGADCGAVVSFVGTVRATNHGKTVVRPQLRRVAELLGTDDLHGVVVVEFGLDHR